MKFQVIDNLHCTFSVGWLEVNTSATQKTLILSSCIAGVYIKVLVVTCRPFTVVIADVAPVSMVSSVVSGLPVSLYHLILAAGKQPDVTQLNIVARPAIICVEVGSASVTPVMGTKRQKVWWYTFTYIYSTTVLLL